MAPRPYEDAQVFPGSVMDAADSHLSVRLARTDRDLAAAERLRYDVFVGELGGDGPLVDHAAGREHDDRDAVCDHLVLVDDRLDPVAGSHVVGVYRLLPGGRADKAGGFYSAREYDLAPLLTSGRQLLELGRSCVHPDYRGGTAMFRLWQGLAAYVAREGADILFGVASFPGADPEPIAPSLSLLHHRHLAPPPLRVRARGPERWEMDRVATADNDRVAAMRAVPALVKAYLRLGGVVGDGAWVDQAFNTTDVCVVLDTKAMTAGASARYGAPGGADL